MGLPNFVGFDLILLTWNELRFIFFLLILLFFFKSGFDVTGFSGFYLVSWVLKGHYVVFSFT